MWFLSLFLPLPKNFKNVEEKHNGARRFCEKFFEFAVYSLDRIQDPVTINKLAPLVPTICLSGPSQMCPCFVPRDTGVSL